MRAPEARYPHVVRALAESPWAVLPSTFEAICEVVALRLEGRGLGEEEISARIAAGAGRREPYPASGGQIAVVPLYGVLMPRANLMTEMSGGTSLERAGAAIAQAAADPQVSAIVLDVNSPGGAVGMTPETAAQVREARRSKRVVAVANTLAASGAYWLASQADEVVASPSALLGSIGVISIHEDVSAQQEQRGVRTTIIRAGRFKGEGNPLEPLTDEGRAALQAMADHYYGMFVADVARGRGVGRDEVRTGFGEGRVLVAADAVRAGLADRVDTLEATIVRIAREQAAPGRARAGAAAEHDGTDQTQPSEHQPAAEAGQKDGADIDGRLLAEIRDRLQETTTRLKEAHT